MHLNTLNIEVQILFLLEFWQFKSYALADVLYTVQVLNPIE